MQYLDFVLSEVHGLRVQELLAAKRPGAEGGRHLLRLRARGDHPGRRRRSCVGLCAGADFGTEAAEKVLPRNTCALIKSFFGFKLARLCPYIDSCDLVVGETTCDGKKKAYEIFGEYAPCTSWTCRR